MDGRLLPMHERQWVVVRAVQYRTTAKRRTRRPALTGSFVAELDLAWLCEFEWRVAEHKWVNKMGSRGKKGRQAKE